MPSYKELYIHNLGYDESDFIPCEVCRQRAVDIHHIDCKGMGGSKLKDFIENLMALCRSCHDKYGDKKQYMLYLLEIHLTYLVTKKVITNARKHQYLQERDGTIYS